MPCARDYEVSGSLCRCLVGAGAPLDTNPGGARRLHPERSACREKHMPRSSCMPNAWRPSRSRSHIVRCRSMRSPISKATPSEPTGMPLLLFLSTPSSSYVCLFWAGPCPYGCRASPTTQSAPRVVGASERGACRLVDMSELCSTYITGPPSLITKPVDPQLQNASVLA